MGINIQISSKIQRKIKPKMKNFQQTSSTCFLVLLPELTKFINQDPVPDKLLTRRDLASQPGTEDRGRLSWGTLQAAGVDASKTNGQMCLLAFCYKGRWQDGVCGKSVRCIFRNTTPTAVQSVWLETVWMKNDIFAAFLYCPLGPGWHWACQ